MLSFASCVFWGTKPFFLKYSRNSSAKITYLSSVLSKLASNSAWTLSQRSRMSLTTIRSSSEMPFLNSNSSSERATLIIPDTSALCSVLSSRFIRSIRCETSVISVGTAPWGRLSIFALSSSSPNALTWFMIALAFSRVERSVYRLSLFSISSISFLNSSRLSQV